MPTHTRPTRAFLSPLPLVAPRPVLSTPSCSHRPSVTRPVSRRTIYASSSSSSSSPSSSGEPRPVVPPAGVWDGISRAIKVSTVSTTLLLASLFVPHDHRRIHGPSPASAAATPTTTTTTAAASASDTSDVEAAALTLGAVTLGGLVMRLIINRSRDDESEKKRLADQCDRLQQEEHNRTLRMARTQLESIPDPQQPTSQTDVGGDGDGVDLMSELRKRVESLENNAKDSNANANTDTDNKDIRHSPIPDRGTGSALLDRPDATNEYDSDDAQNKKKEKDETKDDEDDLAAKSAKPEQLEMLKRMWNLSPPDKEKE